MGSLIRAVKCKSCGDKHDLFYAANEPISRNGRYVYSCPETGEETVFRRAGTDPSPAPKCPAGAITIERSHREL